MGSKATAELTFTADQAAGEAFAAIFARLLAMLRENLEGTLAGTDPEYLHDFRVAVRRARAALKFAHGIVEADVRDHGAAQLRWLGRQTSRCRDLDVHLRDYDDLTDRGTDPASLRPFHGRLVRQRDAAHTGLNRMLRSERFEGLLLAWERDLATTATGPMAAMPLRPIAEERLATAWRRVHERGRAISDDSPAAALHDLRKRCKELRYLLEFFAGLHEPRAHRHLVKQLKRLQDSLGEFQDRRVQTALVHEHAAAFGERAESVATVLSLRDLERQLTEDRDRARAVLADRWREFDTAQNQRLYDALTTG